MSVTAGTLLTRGGIEPASVRAVLPHVDPDRVKVRLAPRAFRAVWAKGVVAVTTPWGVYVTPEIQHRIDAGTSDRGLAVLMVHELTHVDQLKRLGVIRHLGRYLGSYGRSRVRGWGHWDAYRKVPAEVEARYVADGFSGETHDH